MVMLAFVDLGALLLHPLPLWPGQIQSPSTSNLVSMTAAESIFLAHLFNPFFHSSIKRKRLDFTL